MRRKCHSGFLLPRPLPPPPPVTDSAESGGNVLRGRDAYLPRPLPCPWCTVGVGWGTPCPGTQGGARSAAARRTAAGPEVSLVVALQGQIGLLPHVDTAYILYYLAQSCYITYNITTLYLNGTLSCNSLDFMDVIMGDIPQIGP